MIRKEMNSDRKAAIIAGVLLIIADVFGILSHILSKPLLDAPDYLNKIFANTNQIYIAARDYIVNVMMLMSWGIAAFLYCYIFYQSKLVPRWLSGWGLVVYPLLILVSILTMFHLIIVEDTIWSVLVIPAALQELALAAWLIIKGFNPLAIYSGSAKVDMS